MRKFAISLAISSLAVGIGEAQERPAGRIAPPDVYVVAPGLGEYTDNVLFGDVWERPGLSKRDRSLITVAALVTAYRPQQMPFHIKRALENGVWVAAADKWGPEDGSIIYAGRSTVIVVAFRM